MSEAISETTTQDRRSGGAAPEMLGPEMLGIICPACKAGNRIPRAMAGRRARCGRCHVLLPAPGSGYPVAVRARAFRAEVMHSPLPVLVDFWAEWCSPCRQLAPVLSHVATEYAGRLKVVKINVDENAGLARQFQIRSVPTMLLFADGRVREQVSGAMPARELRRWIHRSLGWV